MSAIVFAFPTARRAAPDRRRPMLVAGPDVVASIRDGLLDAPGVPPRITTGRNATGEWTVEVRTGDRIGLLTAAQAVTLASDLRVALPYPGAADDALALEEAACRCVLNGPMAAPRRAWAPRTGEAGLALLIVAICLFALSHIGLGA